MKRVNEFKEMSELIPEKGVCRIKFESDDKDDFLLDSESDVELFEIISVDDSNGEEDEDENRLILKRKNDEKEEDERPSSAQWGDILQVGSIVQKSTVKRFKTDREHTTIGNKTLQQQDTIDDGMAVNQTNTVSELKNSLKDDEIIKEISERTGLSQSYLLKTDAVRKLAESFFALKGSTCSPEEQIKQSSNDGSSDISPSMPITSKQSEILVETVTMQENEDCEGVQVPPQISTTINPLRAFRLHKNVEQTKEKTIPDSHEVKQNRIIEPLNNDLCTIPQQQEREQNTMCKILTQETSQPVELMRKTILSLPIPREVRCTILQQLELDEHSRDEFSDTSFERITSPVQEFDQNAKTEPYKIVYCENGISEMSLQGVYENEKPEQGDGDWLTLDELQLGQYGPDELIDTSMQSTILRLQQPEPSKKIEAFNTLLEGPHNDGCTTLQQLQHERDMQDKILDELLKQALEECSVNSQQQEFEVDGVNAPFDTYLLKTTSHLQQLGERRKTQTSYTSLETAYDTDCTDSQDELSVTPPQMHELEQHCQDELSGTSKEMSDDTFNIKMAAEALSLMKNNGKPSLPSEPLPYVFVPNLNMCSTSDKYEEKRELEFSIQTCSKPGNCACCSTLPQTKDKHRVLFDSTLEITDAVTGVKIPFEALNLNKNKNPSFEVTNSIIHHGKTISDNYMQLSDSVTCVKVPVPNYLLCDEEIAATQSDPWPTTSSGLDVANSEMKNTAQVQQRSYVTKAIKSPLKVVSLFRNEEVLKEKIKSRHLPKLDITEKFSKLLDGDICVHVPLEATGLLNIEDDTKKSTDTRHVSDTLPHIDVGMTKSYIISDTLLQIPHQSTLVNIPLESIYLPKTAAAGVKIPLDSTSWPRNRAIDRTETSSDQKKAEQYCKSADESNKNRNEENGMEPWKVIGKLVEWHKLADTKNVKLPLEPRLRKGYVEHRQEQKVIRSHLSVEKPSNMNHCEPLLAAPQFFANEYTGVMLRQQLEDKTKVDLPNVSPHLASNTNSNKVLSVTPVFKQLGDVIPFSPSSQLFNAKSSKIPNEGIACATMSKQHQNEETNQRPGVPHTYPQISNIPKSLFGNENITKQETQKKQVAESENPRPQTSCRPSVIMKTVSTPDALGSVKNEDIKTDRTNSQKNSENGNTKSSDIFSQLSSAAENIKTPLDAFKLLISDEMIQRILIYTNVRIAKLAQFSTKKRDCFKYPANENELRAFLGLLLISTAFRENKITVREMWSECFGAGIYRATLHEYRFKILLQGICFGESKKCIIRDEFTRNGDIWEEYLTNCKKHSFVSIHLSKTNEKTETTTTNIVEIIDDGQNYTTTRKTANMSLRILFSMLDGASVRGLAIFQRRHPSVGLTQREFLKQVGMSLVTEHLRSKVLKLSLKSKDRELINSVLSRRYENELVVRNPTSPDNNYLKKRKRCQLCTWNDDRKTSYQCESCQRAVCKDHCIDVCVECFKQLL